VSATKRFHMLVCGLPSALGSTKLCRTKRSQAARAIHPPFTLSKVLRFAALAVAIVILPCLANGQTPATGTVTIPSIPAYAGTCDGVPWDDFWVVTVNGVSATLIVPNSNPQSWTTAEVGQNLAGSINANISFITASASQNVITLTTKATGSATNYPFSGAFGISPEAPTGFPPCVGYLSGLPTSGPTLTGGMDAPVQGYINPKFIIVGVTYAPPGAQSSVTYTNSLLVGNTTTINSSFTDSTSVSVSVTASGSIPGFAKGDATGTSTTTYGQTSSSSNTVTINKTTQVSDKTQGPSNSLAGLNHDFDVIWLWLNPVVLLAFPQGNPSALTWNGYGFDANDQPGLDVLPVFLGWLNGDIPVPNDVAAVLARTWASGYIWAPGTGPGLTGPGSGTDFATILQADPFGQCTPMPANCPMQPDSTRFTLSDNQNIVYEQAPPGGQPITQTYQLQYSNTSMQGQGTMTMLSQAFGLEVKLSGGIFGSGISTDFKASNTFTWMTSVNTSTTNAATSTALASVTGPTCAVSIGGNTCSPQYIGPVEFEIYQDNQYGTFMFFPVSGSNGQPLSMPISTSLPDAIAGEPYAPVLLTATGGSGTGYTWCVQSGPQCVQSGPPLPTGFALSSRGTCGKACSTVILSSPGIPAAQADLYNVTVQVVDSAGNMATQLVTLNIQPGPVVGLSPLSLTFDTQLVNATSFPQTVTLTNAGSAPLNVTAISTTSDFSQTNTCGASIPAAATCSIRVTFAPSAVGQRTGVLSISDNVGGSPQVISLSGSGTDFSLNAANGGSTSATVMAGQPAIYNLEVDPLDGFSGSVGLACTVATLVTCTVTPQTLNVSGGSPAAFTVTVSRTPLAASASIPFGVSHPSLLWFGLTVFVLSLFEVKRIGGRTTFKPKPRWGFAGVLLFLVMTLLSCAGRGGGGGGTPTGTYTLTVTGSQQNVKRTLNLTLIVN
jgi:hypothetical protein